MFLTIIIVIASIVILLTIHEFGHFVVAKRFGVKVEEFGIGLPPRLFGKQIGETLYSLNLIPFGAFVKVYGEEGGIESARSFSGIPIWQRALIVLAGVVSFWLVAIILLTVVFNLGVSQAISDQEQGPLLLPKVQVAAVAPNSPAETAGIKPGDTIRELRIPEGEPSAPYGAGTNYELRVDKIKEVQEFTQLNRGEEIVLTIERGRDVFDVSLIPRVSSPAGEGAMGVALVRTAEKSYPFFQAFIKGIETTFNLTQTIVRELAGILVNLIKGQGLPPGVQFVGPIGVGSLAVGALQVGVSYFFRFIAVIAVYLAIFNSLPIPALDGGKLLFLGIEKLKGRQLNQKIEQKITAGFFILFITLMLWVTIKDVVRLF